jgi:hypothetical protein
MVHWPFPIIILPAARSRNAARTPCPTSMRATCAPGARWKSLSIEGWCAISAPRT